MGRGRGERLVVNLGGWCLEWRFAHGGGDAPSSAASKNVQEPNAEWLRGRSSRAPCREGGVDC